MSELRGARVVLRPLAAGDAPVLRAMRASPAVAPWWGPGGEEFPLSDDPDSTRFTIWAGDEIAGLVQYGEEPDPDYRQAWIDIFVGPGFDGRGLGGDAIATLIAHLFDDRGHHRITIDPAVDNARAIRAYERAGFRRVGVLEAAWRDPEGRWRDMLLMELVRRGG